MRCFKSCPREGASQSLHTGLQDIISFKSCPREGASEAQARSGCSSWVSSHAPVRGHPSAEELRIHPGSFKSCPREGASPVWVCLVVSASPVSSHAPVRGHPQAAAGAAARIIRFKSCPREGASNINVRYGRIAVVSSHAPVRGHPYADAIDDQIYTFQVMPP